MIARPMHLFSFLIHRMGNVMVLFFKPQEAKVLHKQNWFLATGPAVCEAMAQICLFTGIVLSCAQLKTIIYCSGSVWSAIGAWLFLQKKLNKWQIVATMLMFFFSNLSVLALAVLHFCFYYLGSCTCSTSSS